MKIGCQIGVWGGSPDNAAKEMSVIGVSGIEVFTGHLVPYYGMEKEVRDFLAENNIELSGAYFNNDKFISPSDEESVIAEASTAAKFLGSVGSRFIILNGGISRSQREFSTGDFRQLARTMNSIGKAVREFGVEACMHPHVGCMIESPKELDILLEYLDTSLVGLCLHAAHQVIAGYDPYEMYEKHPELVTYLHIGEISDDKKGAFLGEGMLDQKRLMKPLLDAGYDGWIVIESSKGGVTPRDYVIHSINYIKNSLLK